jgi:hypothetical protein
MPKVHDVFFKNDTKYDLVVRLEEVGKKYLNLKIFDPESHEKIGLMIPSCQGMIKASTYKPDALKKYLGFFSGKLRVRVDDRARHALFKVNYDLICRGRHRFIIIPNADRYSRFEPWNFHQVELRNKSKKNVLVSLCYGPKGKSNLYLSHAGRMRGSTEWYLNLEPDKSGLVPPEILSTLVGVSPTDTGSDWDPTHSLIGFQIDHDEGRITVDIFSKEEEAQQTP